MTPNTHKYIDKKEEANLVLLAMRAANYITGTPIGPESIKLARDTLDRMETLFNSIVEEAERRERAVLDGNGS